MDADLSTELTFEKIMLMLVATPGMIAPAATATKPAIKAYSIRSWPWVSLHRTNRYRIVMAKCKAVLCLGTLRQDAQKRCAEYVDLLPRMGGAKVMKFKVAHYPPPFCLTKTPPYRARKQ